ncbi:MAG TPA: NAD-dependent epimerase/dehydratase family protein, partial [Acidimicrobiia bacterium]
MGRWDHGPVGWRVEAPLVDRSGPVTRAGPTRTPREQDPAIVRRALVTGAAGFIGCHLVSALHDTGCAVTGIDDERSGDWHRVEAPCTQV